MTEPTPDKTKLSLDDVNALSREDFVATFGEIFEHSPWVAQQAFDARPFSSVDHLHEAMAKELDAAESMVKLTLIRAHPNLAAKVMRGEHLSGYSSLEQTGAGLDTCSENEGAELQSLNQRYRMKFGFPCIIAVKGLDKQQIFKTILLRQSRTRESEFSENLIQILRIAKFRLEELVDAGDKTLTS